MPTITVRVRGARSARRPDNLAPILVILAVLCAAGAVASAVAHRHNQARLARYRDDPACAAPPAGARGGSLHAAPLVAPATPAQGAACTVERARVAGRWIHYLRSTPTYRLAIRTAEGIVDTVELEDTGDRDVWDAAPEGSALVVQRFAESGSARPPHVTVVSVGDRATRTAWNPAWREDDAEVGIVFLSIGCVGALVALRYVRRRRRSVTPDAGRGEREAGIA